VIGFEGDEGLTEILGLTSDGLIDAFKFGGLKCGHHRSKKLEKEEKQFDVLKSGRSERKILEIFWESPLNLCSS
jgi:hypothetical protein